MEQFKKLRRMTIAIGLITLISMVFAVLALADIHKAIEADFSTEWAIIRLAFFLVTVFIALTMATIWHGSKRKM